MSKTVEKPIIVVGGGLGGLSAAVVLGRMGRAVQVLEQAPEIAPIGYGIQLGPNIFRVFDKLGVTDAVLAASDQPDALVMPDAESGDMLMRIDLKSTQFKGRYRAPYVIIHRADLHEVLLDVCRKIPAVELAVSATVERYEETSDGVRVFCEDGRCFEGEALIGADGLRSRIRGNIVTEAGPEPIGYVAHRTLVPMQNAPAGLPYMNDVVLWSGPGSHVVHYPLRHHTLFNVVAVFRSPHPGKPEGYASHAEEVAAVYANAHPDLKKIIAMMDLERRWVLADRPPIRNWSRGRVTLLGDAAHPTLQSYAQGACMAIEDATCLADMLIEHNFAYEQAFVEYQKRRVLRTARVQLGSRALWGFYHAEGMARDVRNAELQERSAEDSYRCLDWLWNPPAQAT